MTARTITPLMEEDSHKPKPAGPAQKPGRERPAPKPPAQEKYSPRPEQEEPEEAGYISSRLTPLDAEEPILTAPDAGEIIRGSMPSIPAEDMDDSSQLMDMVDSEPLEPILSEDSTLTGDFQLTEEKPSEEEIKRSKPLITGPIMPPPRKAEPEKGKTLAEKAPPARPAFAGKPGARPATPSSVGSPLPSQRPPAAKKPAAPPPAQQKPAAQARPAAPARPAPPAAGGKPPVAPGLKKPAPIAAQHKPAAAAPATPAAKPTPMAPAAGALPPTKEAAPITGIPAFQRPAPPHKMQPILSEDSEIGDHIHIGDLMEEAVAGGLKEEPEMAAAGADEVAEVKEEEQIHIREEGAEEEEVITGGVTAKAEMAAAGELPSEIKPVPTPSERELAAEGIMIPTGEEEEEKVTVRGETQKAEMPAAGELPSEIKPVPTPSERELAAEGIMIPTGEEEEEKVTVRGETQKAEMPAAGALPSETKPIQTPSEKELAAEGIMIPTGEEEEEKATVRGETQKADMAAAPLGEGIAGFGPLPSPEEEEALATKEKETAMVDQDMVATEAYAPAKPEATGLPDQAPMETLRAEPEEKIMTTRPEREPMETVAAGPQETISAEGPKETISAEGPKETISAEGPKETISAEGPKETMAAEMAEQTSLRFIDTSMLTGVSEVEDNVQADWNPGDLILDLYEVKSLLGEGGMGKVYKVRHRGWNIELAVKSPKPSELSKVGGAEAFEEEAETWVNLGLHPNTVSCYYVRRLGGIPRVFAEFVDGGSMHDWIKDGKLSDITSMLDVAIQFAWGLDYAHERGLVHQDIKPANVMMTQNGVAKVTDFGLAKAKSRSGGKSGGLDAGDLVAFGGMTPAYCSPEQADRARLSAKTDMWSWALSILEMFVGETTWMFGVAANEALEAYLADGPVNKTLPKAPDGLVKLLRDCFHMDAAERPESMMDVADRLLDIYAKTTGSAYPRKAPRAGRATADSLNNRAISFLDLGQFEEASALWQEALINEPHHPQSTYNAGLVNWRAAKISDMDLVREVEESVKSHGADSDCEYYLGLVHLERDDCEEAIEALRKILKTSYLFQPAMDAGKEAHERLAASRKLEMTLKGHVGSANSIAVAGGGGLRLFSGGDDHTVIQWNMGTGANEKSLEPDKYPVTRVATTLDGGLLLTGGFGVMRMWNLQTGKLLRETKAHDGWIGSIAISDDASKIMSAGWDRTVKVWSLETGEKLAEMKGHMGMACMSGDGRLILFGGEDNSVKMVLADTGALVRSFDMAPGAMALSPNGKLVLLAGLDNSISVFDARRGQLYKKMVGHRAMVAGLAVNQEGTMALSCGYDKTVRLWDLYSGRCLRTFEGHEETVNSVQFTHDSKHGISCSQDGQIRRWSLHAQRPFVAPLMVSRVQASEIVLSAGAAYEEKIELVQEALSRRDAKAAQVAVREAREQHGFSRGAEALEALGALYLLSARKTLSGGWESKVMGGHTGAVNCVTISFDCTTAFSAGSDRAVRMWDLRSFREKKIMEGHSARVNHLAVSADGEMVVSAGGEGAIKVWNVKTGASVDLDGHKGAVTRVALTSDKKFVVSGGADRTVKVWDIKNRRIIRSLRAHQGEITS
ncbi:MAG: protein kinase, partial [Nitrospinota bacterium]|nr:protein kinase [Nitrospinota bacterium]